MRRCRDLRRRCTAGGPGDPRLADHLATCAGCRAFVERLTLVREALAAPLSDARPDAGFAARVAARRPPQPPVEVLGWAAVRLLPAAVALLVALAACGQWRPPALADLWLLQPSTGELLVWSMLPD